MRLHFLLALAAAVAVPALAAGKAELERGRSLLAQYRCGSCHAIPGVESAHGTVAQPLAAWKQRSYIAGRLPNRAPLLVRWIREPKSLVPDTLMPSMGVSAADAHAMAAYLLSLE